MYPGRSRDIEANEGSEVEVRISACGMRKPLKALAAC